MQKINLYTTVTVSDFQDKAYINHLIDLNIGVELALLTPLSDITQYKKDLDALKKEIEAFKDCFNQYNIPVDKVRIHQPGGYAYYWSDHDKISGYNLLKDFFSYCYDSGFRNFVIHPPYGNSNIDQLLELDQYKEKIKHLIPADATLEVEEISVSNDELENSENIRFYSGPLFETLMQDQPNAIMLLDTYECGGVDATIKRFKDLTSKGFEIKSIHLHKDKHKFLTSDEVALLLNSNFCGNLVNEGFLQDESSFDEFIKTKSMKCVVPNIQRIEILKSYNV